MSVELLYTGKALEKPAKIERDGHAPETIPPYYPGDELVKSIELAFLLRRPLLLMGEPGCGKTKVAQAVAYEIYGAAYRDYYFEWNIKSTSKARDGLYTFDHLRRLRDVELARASGKPLSDKPEAENLEQYISMGELGKAFESSKKDFPAILLIDEIDKADIDFPNDLLLELDQRRFTIEETGRNISASEPPLIFITSNEEKELPPAFLRRCLFHYIEFPQPKTMREIVAANFPKLTDTLLDQIIKRFYDLRNAMQEDPNTEKKASTSELLDWAKAINYYHSLQREQAIEGDQLLHYQALLKTLNDSKLHKSAKKNA